jgi:pyruvate,orthophosphate dikinase
MASAKRQRGNHHMSKWVYRFGGGEAEGRATDVERLGGKGANLAEMAILGLPVPPGLTIVADACVFYFENGRTLSGRPEGAGPRRHCRDRRADRPRLRRQRSPAAFSVRSGARASMPGMMDTVLNLGLNDETVQSLGHDAGDARFAWDSYRRFIQMYADVVMGLDHEIFEEILEDEKARLGHDYDTDLSAVEWQHVVSLYKRMIEDELGSSFPQDPHVQLWGAIRAVFSSWMNPRAMTYRMLHRIPEEWGTAVNVQTMVFGNLGSSRRRPASPSPAIPRPARRRSTASFWSMRKGRMSSPVSVRRNRSPRKGVSLPAPTNRRWKS